MSQPDVLPEVGLRTAVEAAGGTAGQRAKRASLRPLLALRPYIVRYPGMLGLAFAALIVSAGTMLLVPRAVQRMIDFGFSAGDSGFIDRYFVGLIGLGILLALSSSTRFFAVNWLGERVVTDIRADVFQHLASLGPAFFDRTHSGELMSRLTADTTQIKSASGSALSQALRNMIMLLGALAMMFVTSTRLSLMVLLAIPAIVLPLMAYGRTVRDLSRKAQDSIAGASAYAGENLQAARTMQAFGQEGAVSNRYRVAVEAAFEAARKRLYARAVLTAIAMGLIVASIVGVLWVGSSAVIAGTMTGGLLGQFLLYALFAGGAMAELSEVWGEMAQAAGSAERLAELLATRSDISNPAQPVIMPSPARGDIAFEAVSFQYPSRPDAQALKGVTFTVARGERVALVGPSGAGKTTVFNLLLRFYDPASGTIRVDGVPIQTADLGALRSRMATVPQEVALFADTVAANIGYGAPGASRADIVKAAEAAHAAEFIASLPQGYETVLGERGVTLSGGQRQRLAIARAVLRNAPILLLDEATSALDAESELLVQKALESVMKDRTSLVIAHRLATVQKADRILVLQAGAIVEEGRHAELVARGGLYTRLADLQFGREAAE